METFTFVATVKLTAESVDGLATLLGWDGTGSAVDFVADRFRSHSVEWASQYAVSSNVAAASAAADAAYQGAIAAAKQPVDDGATVEVTSEVV